MDFDFINFTEDRISPRLQAYFYKTKYSYIINIYTLLKHRLESQLVNTAPINNIFKTMAMQNSPNV